MVVVIKSRHYEVGFLSFGSKPMCVRAQTSALTIAIDLNQLKKERKAG
jgi:hypothetical protein